METEAATAQSSDSGWMMDDGTAGRQVVPGLWVWGGRLVRQGGR